MKNYALALLITSAFIVAQEVTERQTQTFAFDIKGELDIETANGSIEVVGSDNHDELVVEVVKHAPNKETLALIEPSIELHDKDTQAKMRVRMQPQAQGSIDFKVHVSRYVEVKAKSKNGAISVRNVTGQQKAETHNGAITIDGVRKETEARSKNGAISISYANNAFGKADVKTDNGAVVVSNAGGSVDIKTENGAVQVSQRVLPHKDDIKIKTLAGNISLALPAQVNATIKAETKMGAIGGDTFPWERKEKKMTAVTGDEAKLVLGKGYASVDLSTKTGAINVQKK